MTTNIEKAKRDLENLEEQRETLFSRAKLLTQERDEIAFAALADGDEAAEARLSDINSESTDIDAKIGCVEAALIVARANLEAAKRDEALAVDNLRARQLREKLKTFVELGLLLDECFADFSSTAVEMKAVLDDIHSLGQAFPTAQQFRVNCDLAFKTAVQGTPFWSQDFPALGHGQRKTFRSLVESWSASIERNIAARLGEDRDKDAA